MFSVTHRTPDRLVISFRPLLLLGILASVSIMPLIVALSGALGPAGSVLFYLIALGPVLLPVRFLPFRRYVFDRQTGKLTRVEWRFLDRQVHSMPLSDVEAAVIQERRSAKNRQMQRLALQLYDQTVALDPVWSSLKVERVAAEINDWLCRSGAAARTAQPPMPPPASA
ncbi:hypothetical protein H0I76_16080 [Limibaculum sp. M0105]|uniref:Uncharacterized protein n=1 Tax=Thermohalobaculum xanthum TaxID=2753746 RepID=A0A8J7M9N1_9RHOB|nr:hypothetical protein [Thermohalobaculum xanthum]MBK0400718.1 hypothetical protein [Thermohalobaculum xanthum]